MRYTKIRTKIIAFAIAGCMLCSNALPLFANNSVKEYDYKIEKSDSINVKSTQKKQEENLLPVTNILNVKTYLMFLK